MDSPLVSFTPGALPGALDWDAAAPLIKATQACEGNPATIVRLLRGPGQEPPVHGTGRTLPLWEFLATLGSIDLAAARVVEPHLDAASILHEAGIEWEPGASWGVYAAEGKKKVVATESGDPAGPWTLSGEKPWCSLATVLDRAVVTAHVAGGRRAFTVDLKHPGVRSVQTGWASHGLAQIPSEPVVFDGVPAIPVGPTNWYLQRPGFAHGGVGVAACWFGGAVGIYRSLSAACQAREPDQLALAWLGEADRLLAAAATSLSSAARSADERTLGWASALRVRGLVAEVCERLIRLAGHAMGPAPLGFDASHARRVADLGIYLRQHHAARDDAALGSLLLQDVKSAGGTRSRW